jgi:hypothetical protein
MEDGLSALAADPDLPSKQDHVQIQNHSCLLDNSGMVSLF